MSEPLSAHLSEQLRAEATGSSPFTTVPVSLLDEAADRLDMLEGEVRLWQAYGREIDAARLGLTTNLHSFGSRPMNGEAE